MCNGNNNKSVGSLNRWNVSIWALWRESEMNRYQLNEIDCMRCVCIGHVYVCEWIVFCYLSKRIEFGIQSSDEKLDMHMNWAERQCWEPFKINDKRIMFSCPQITLAKNLVQLTMLQGNMTPILIHEDRLIIIVGHLLELSNSQINANHRMTKKWIKWQWKQP